MRFWKKLAKKRIGNPVKRDDFLHPARMGGKQTGAKWQVTGPDVSEPLVNSRVVDLSFCRLIFLLGRFRLFSTIKAHDSSFASDRSDRSARVPRVGVVSPI